MELKSYVYLYGTYGVNYVAFFVATMKKATEWINLYDLRGFITNRTIV